jgi:hypothetical protein
MDFARMRETIQTGYDTVMQNRAQFERLALTEVEYDAFVAARRDPRMTELPTVEFVRLDNGGPVADSVVAARLGAIKLGEPLDVDAVEQAMNTVYGLDYYQNVRYGLVDDADGTGIELQLDARSWGPNYLQLGMEYSSAADSDSLFGLAASYLAASGAPPSSSATSPRSSRTCISRSAPKGSISTPRRCISSRRSSTFTRATSASPKRSCARLRSSSQSGASS